MRSFVLLICAMTLVSYRAFAGGDVGNGGDSVECVQSTESPFAGYFNLDYLFNVISDSEYAKDFGSILAPTDPYDAQFRKIIKATQSISPSFSRALTVYHENLFKNSSSTPYTWKKAPYGVIELDDQNLRLKLPANCLRSGSGKPFVQSIVRDQKPNQIEFTYYTEALKRLPPLQLSFLLFHEWLWNFTSDPEIVRNANAIIHSAEWSEWTAAKKLGDLYQAGLGFVFNDPVTQLKPAKYEISILDDKAYLKGVRRAEEKNGVMSFWVDFSSDLVALEFANLSSKSVFVVPYYSSMPEPDIGTSRIYDMQIPVHQSRFAMLEKQKYQGIEVYCVYLADGPKKTGFGCDPHDTNRGIPKYILYLNFNLP